MSSSDFNAKGGYNVYGIDIALEPLENQEETEQSRKESGNKKIRRRYCKHCGSLINNTTKQCTGCGKQYFKGFRAYKYPIIILILFIAISVMLVAGAVQYLNTQQQIIELQNTILEQKEKNSQLEKDLERIKKYAPNYYVDDNGKTIKIH